MTTNEHARERFGVAGIVDDAFNVFFRRFGLMFALALVPAAIGFLTAEAIGSVVPAIVADHPVAEVVVSAVVAIVVILLGPSLSNSLIVLAAFDAKIGRPVRFGLYVRSALANLFAVVMLSIGSVVLVLAPIVLLAVTRMAGLIILAIPLMFYLWSAFTPLVPVIVIEGAGFRALGRAWALTRGYRWPIGSAVIMIYFVGGVIEKIGDLVGKAAASVEDAWLPVLANNAAAAISDGFIAVGIAMIYARLRSIKEGVDIGSLAEVFA